MRRTVLLFAVARQLADRGEIAVEVEAGATVADLKRALARSCPPLEPLLSRVRIAVDASYAEDDDTLPDHGELAVIPPVSGGSPHSPRSRA